jgi:hypothetical protein
MKRPRKLLDLVWTALQRGDSTCAAILRTGVPGIRHLALIPALAVVLSLLGCQQPYSGAVPPPDEAMVRAQSEGKTPEQAARDYFYPKEIVDYFPRMDSVGLPAEGAADWPDQLWTRSPGGRQRAAEGRGAWSRLSSSANRKPSAGTPG